MKKSQIAKLLTELQREADKRNVEIDESFVEQLLVLKLTGKERSADSQKVEETLDHLARAALTKASKAGDARVGAGALINALDLSDNPWDLGGLWDLP